MATHKSAEKRARQSEKRRERNRAVRSQVRTLVRQTRRALEKGDVPTARESLRTTEKALRQAAGKGVLKKRTASRSVSRLARAVHKAEAGGAS